MKKIKFPGKFVGPIGWGKNPLSEEIDRLIFRSKDEIIIQLSSGGYDYDVKLRRTEGEHFKGSYQRKRGAEFYKDTVSCSLYSNDTNILLLGEWIEDGEEYKWWAELEETDKFDDEN